MEAGLFDNVSNALSFVLSNPREPDNPIIYASENFFTTTGYGRGEILGRNCRILQGPGTSRQAVLEIRDAIREERATSVCLLNYKKDGTPFWNAFHLSPVKNKDGVAQYYVGIQADVTDIINRKGQGELGAVTEDEEKNAEKIAKEIQSHAEEIHSICKTTCAVDEKVPSSLLIGLSTIRDSFCLTDPNRPGNPMVYCSPGFLAMTGYNAEELCGKNCSMLQGADTDEGGICKIREALSNPTPKPVSVVLKNYTKSGEPFWNSIHIAPVRDASGNVKFFCGVQSKIDSAEDDDVELMANPIQLLRQKGVVGAVRVAARGLSDNGFQRKQEFQTPCRID